MRLIPTPADAIAAAVNLYDATVRGGLADKRRMPSALIDEGPQRRVHRYHALGRGGRRSASLPVLLVPPLAAPAICFDLRRGCSLAEHLLQRGHETYLVDYGPVRFGDRSLGLEHWIEEVLPRAVRAVSDDAGGRPVQLVGWCLGGILALLAQASDPDLPIASTALVASPFDFSRVPLVAPLRPIAAVTQGQLVTQLYRVLGGAPAPLVKRGYQLAGFDKYVMKPWTIAEQPARPRAAGADRGGRRVHGQHARVSRAHVRPALPPLLPLERPRGRPAGARRPHARPRRRPRAGAGDRRARRRDRAHRGLPPRRRAARRRAVRPARDRAGRASRRADREGGARHHLGRPRPLPRRARGAPAGRRRRRRRATAA